MKEESQFNQTDQRYKKHSQRSENSWEETRHEYWQSHVFQTCKQQQFDENREFIKERSYWRSQHNQWGLEAW